VLREQRGLSDDDIGRLPQFRAIGPRPPTNGPSSRAAAEAPPT